MKNNSYQEYLEKQKTLTVEEKQKTKVEVCSDTKNIVIKEQLSDGEWLCLHSDNTEDDIRFANEFLENGVVSEEFFNYSEK